MPTTTLHWQLTTFFRFLFGLHLVYSGTAYVLFGWVPNAFSNEASPVGQFMVALDDVGLYSLVKHVELFLGAMVLANRFVPLVAVAELPITIIIAYLNIVVEGPIQSRHYYTGVQELVINGAVLLGYSAYYRSMLTARAHPQGLWQRPELSRSSFGAAVKKSGFSIGSPQAWLLIGLFIAAVVAASWFLGPVDRRLPPRDWLPPVLAFASMLVMFQFAKNRALA